MAASTPRPRGGRRHPIIRGIAVDEDLNKRIVAAAERDDRTVTSLIRKVLTEHFSDQPAKRSPSARA